MSYYLIQQIEQNPKIEVRTCTEVVDTCGEDGHLSGLWLEDKRTGDTGEGRLRTHVLFHRRDAPYRVARRHRGPRRPRLHPRRTRPGGRVRLDLDRPPHHLETSVPGVFVAGDVRAESAKRVAAAVGEGSMAVMLVHRYLAET